MLNQQSVWLGMAVGSTLGGVVRCGHHHDGVVAAPEEADMEEQELSAPAHTGYSKVLINIIIKQ